MIIIINKSSMIGSGVRYVTMYSNKLFDDDYVYLISMQETLSVCLGHCNQVNSTLYVGGIHSNITINNLHL